MGFSLRIKLRSSPQVVHFILVKHASRLGVAVRRDKKECTHGIKVQSGVPPWFFGVSFFKWQLTRPPRRSCAYPDLLRCRCCPSESTARAACRP